MIERVVRFGWACPEGKRYRENQIQGKVSGCGFIANSFKMASVLINKVY